MRGIGKALRWSGLALLALALVGAVYNQVGLAFDSRFAPPSAEMVSVRGRAVHVRCLGEGARAILLDSGLGGGVFEWFRLQPLLSARARVCSFDRPGIAWSDDLGGTHDGATLADDLHAIIRAAKISTPFVYVGHSFGANLAQIFYAKHPTDVAALVLLEPGNPMDLLEDFNGSRDEALSAADCAWTCAAGFIASHLGLARLGAIVANAGAKNLPPERIAEYRAGLLQPSNLPTALAYLHALPETAYQAMDVQTFGTTPVLVFIASNTREREADESQAEFDAWHVGYRAHLSSLAAKSSNGRGPIEVPASTHTSMVTGERQSAWVVDEILKFLDETADATATETPRP